MTDKELGRMADYYLACPKDQSRLLVLRDALLDADKTKEATGCEVIIAHGAFVVVDRRPIASVAGDIDVYSPYGMEGPCLGDCLPGGELSQYEQEIYSSQYPPEAEHHRDYRRRFFRSEYYRDRLSVALFDALRWLAGRSLVSDPSVGIRSIRVLGRRWFNRRKGHTYHTYKILINGAVAYEQSQPTYGYGSQFEWNALAWLIGSGHVECKSGTPLSVYCRDNGIEYDCEVVDVGRKKDL